MSIEFELLHALKSNSKDNINQVFERIYKTYFKLGLFISRQYLDDDNAYEVTEEVFVNFFKRIIDNKKCDIKNIKQYLLSSIKNESIREVNRKRKIIEYDDSFHHEQKEDTFIFGNIIFEELNEIEQYIITEHVLLDKTFIEISSDINKPLNTIKSIYRRGCIKAKRKLTLFKK